MDLKYFDPSCTEAVPEIAASPRLDSLDEVSILFLIFFFFFVKKKHFICLDLLLFSSIVFHH